MNDVRPTTPEHLRVGYLSAGLRASTRPESREGGPRAHMLGVINGFEHFGWSVERFIVGDGTRAATHFDASGSGSGRDRTFGLAGIAADVARFGGIGPVNAQRAWRRLGGHVDLVYERSAPLQSLGQQFHRRGVPWVLETNSLQFLEAKSDRSSLSLPGLARYQETRAYQACDVLVCVTDVLKDMIVREAHVPHEKIIVIPNGVDVARFDPAQHRQRERSDELVVGFVGLLYPWQGIDHLIRALAGLPADVHIRAVVVGDGPLRRDWEELARSSGVADRIQFTGRADWNDVPAHIASFDITFSGHQPGLSDARVYFSPLKLYEYMAMAKPVIASGTEDATRLLSADDIGYLYPVGDVDGLRAALLAAWNDRAGLHERGQRARALILREHTWDARVRLLIATMMPKLAEQYAQFR